MTARAGGMKTVGFRTRKARGMPRQPPTVWLHVVGALHRYSWCVRMCVFGVVCRRLLVLLVFVVLRAFHH